jgi:hypothetical protein
MNDSMSFGHAAAIDQIDEFPVVYSTDVVSEWVIMRAPVF